MSDFVKLATTAGDQYLTALAESQENFLKSMSRPRRACPRCRSCRRRRFSPIPTPQAVVDANFAFVTKLLKQQKDSPRSCSRQARSD